MLNTTLTVSLHTFHYLSSVLLFILYLYTFILNIFITCVLYVQYSTLEHLVSRKNHETFHYQIFPASSVTYTI